MDLLRDELFSVPDAGHALAVLVRIVAAGLLGAVIGGERELEGKAAGLRTHMLVSLGAALFIIAPREAGLRGGELRIRRAGRGRRDLRVGDLVGVRGGREEDGTAGPPVAVRRRVYCLPAWPGSRKPLL